MEIMIYALMYSWLSRGGLGRLAGMLSSLLLYPYPILLNTTLLEASYGSLVLSVNTCITDKTGEVMVYTSLSPGICYGKIDPAKQARLFPALHMTYQTSIHSPTTLCHPTFTITIANI